MDEEENAKEYRWESGYEKTWEAIKEDDDGLLDISISDAILRAKRKKQMERKKNARLGMMRHLYVIIDCSEAMASQDLKPTRHLCTIKILESFTEDYFDENPISQMGMIIMRNKRAEKLTDLMGNSHKHAKCLDQLRTTQLMGEPSLKNALDLAHHSLKLIPAHASREILIIMGSLTTCDPNDIHQTIDQLKSDGIRCSVVGLAADILICRKLTRQTGGEYGVILDDSHFKHLVMQHVEPPAAVTCLESSLIKMGFPHQIIMGQDECLTMCMCHLDTANEYKLSTKGYYCPQCMSKYCELPVECRSCGLTLVSASHLARSYHHLFPVNAFSELQLDPKVHSSCYGCQKTFDSVMDKNVYSCCKCQKIFCIDCDLFIHDTLHTCPGCASNIQSYVQ